MKRLRLWLDYHVGGMLRYWGWKSRGRRGAYRLYKGLAGPPLAGYIPMYVITHVAVRRGKHRGEPFGEFLDCNCCEVIGEFESWADAYGAMTSDAMAWEGQEVRQVWGASCFESACEYMRVYACKDQVNQWSTPMVGAIDPIR